MHLMRSEQETVMLPQVNTGSHILLVLLTSACPVVSPALALTAWTVRLSDLPAHRASLSSDLQPSHRLILKVKGSAKASLAHPSGLCQVVKGSLPLLSCNRGRCCYSSNL